MRRQTPRKLVCLAFACVAGILASSLNAWAASSAPGDETVKPSSRNLDLGDFYTTSAGPRHLLRLDGSMVVRLQTSGGHSASLARLIAADGPLAGYALDRTLDGGLTLLRATTSERRRQQIDSALLLEAFHKARRSPDVLSVAPVFLDPESGLARVPTGEILVCLLPGIAPQNYFG